MAAKARAWWRCVRPVCHSAFDYLSPIKHERSRQSDGFTASAPPSMLTLFVVLNTSRKGYAEMARTSAKSRKPESAANFTSVLDASVLYSAALSDLIRLFPPALRWMDRRKY